MNYDGAIFEETKEVGIGVIVCNENCEVLVALSKRISLLSLVKVLEALIARIIIQFIVELGILQLDFARDSKVVYKAIIVGDPPLSAIGHIVKDIVSIASFLRTHSFFHTRRQGNSIAHALAKRARFFFLLFVCMKSIPQNILCFVVCDIPIT